jgi:Repeat of unknown function (DUF346)
MLATNQLLPTRETRLANDGPPYDEPPARVPGRPINNPQPPSRPENPTGQPPPGRGIHVEISPRNVRIVPGEAETAQITVRNQGGVVDEVSLTVRGDPAAWTRVAPDTLNLYPGTQGQATIRFAPPKAPRPLAGLLPLEIAVNSQRQPDSSMVWQGSVELAPYDNLLAAADGTTYLSGRREAVLPVKLRNLGNRPANVYVSAADLPGVTVSLSQADLALDAGAEATVWATIRARAALGAGPPKQLPYTIVVSSDYSPPVTIDGRFEQTPAPVGRSLKWLAIAAGVLVVAGVVAAGVLGVYKLPDLFAGGATGPTLVPTGAPTQGPTVRPTGTGQPPVTAGPTDNGGPTSQPTSPTQPTETATEPTVTDSPSPTADIYVGWANLGGEFSQAAAPVTSGANFIEVFAPWSDGTIYQSGWDTFAWSSWSPLQVNGNNTTNYKPAAINWSDGVNAGGFNVFITAGDGAIHDLTTTDGQTWSDLSLGGNFGGGPAAASWGAGRLDIFGRAPDGTLQHNWFDGGSWNLWEPWPINGPIRASPAAVAWPASAAGFNTIDVFALHDDGGIYHVRYDENAGLGTTWGLIGAGITFNSAPTVTSWAPNEFDVFARGVDGALYQATGDGVNWSNWTTVTTFKLANAPGAVSWAPGRYDLFVIGEDGAMHHHWVDNGTAGPTPSP